jgi:SDR family mycofactocin-dependent oxidoreductase
MTSGDLEGQVAFITGGARGMGRSHALTLAEAGADIVLFDRCADFDTLYYKLAGPEDLAETARMVEKTGRRCLSLQGDVRDFAAVESAVATAVEELGRIDILIANAGISGGGAVQEADPVEWDDVISTNLTGVFHSFRAVSPVMVSQGYGRIVGVSSMMGRAPTGGMGAYVASKWGVIGLVKSSAQDLAAFGITVNAVAPGNIDTPMVRNEGLARRVRPDMENPTFEDAEPFLAMLHSQPIALLPPQDVSAVIMFLVGPGAAHMTGAVMDISAGASARFTA